MAGAEILATGSYLPERVVTNEDMCKLVTTTDEWIQQRSGIKERRYSDEGTGTVELGFKAAQRALETAGCSINDIDLMVCTTQNPQHYQPGTGCFILEEFGCETEIPCIEVRDQCSGFLYGLQIADAYIRVGTYKKILMVSTELHSHGLEYTDDGRHITVLFGDGAGALVLGPSSDENTGVLSTEVHADGRMARELIAPAPGAIEYPRVSKKTLDERKHFPYMNGQLVFKNAVNGMVTSIQSQLAKTGIDIGDVAYFFPHQANKRISQTVAKFLKFPEEKVDCSIERYGNCSSASVPIAIDDAVRDGRIKKGDTFLIATFAAGFTWGAGVVRY